MRQITRTIALAVVLTTTLTATTAIAAPSDPRPRRDRGTVTELVQRIIKRFFGVVTIESDLSVPKPDAGANSGSGQ
ncbi:MAG TPA: hypothetical protein VGF48_01075 [Thermoanaerobaculia bacterium]|jgi:hypothetical protein